MTIASSCEKWQPIENPPGTFGPPPPPLGLSQMVQVCRPDTKKPQDSCYSGCIKKKTDYRWCFTSSEHRGTVWSPCTCKIKPAVLEFLDISRRNMLSEPSNPWTDLEISLIVIASCLGALIAVSTSIAAVAYLRWQGDLAMHQGVVFPNPIFVPEDGQYKRQNKILTISSNWLDYVNPEPLRAGARIFYSFYCKGGNHKSSD